MNLDKTCNICGEPASNFLSFGGGGKAIRCPSCLSFERHRRFKDAFDRYMKHEFSFADKEVLACVPARPSSNTSSSVPSAWFLSTCARSSGSTCKWTSRT
jgi:hypothetical protein